MWRLWTKGWGPRAWWYWFSNEGFPIWIAWHLPRKIALWAFIRVTAATGENPNDITYKTTYDAWKNGAGK